MPAVEFPRLSLPERDRRWAAGSAEGRYLTHIGGNGEDGYVVFEASREYGHALRAHRLRRAYADRASHLSEQVVITAGGYRRLGKLPLEFRST